MSAQKKDFWRGAGRWLPGVLISVVALFVVLRLSSWEDISLAFEAVRPANLAIAAILTVLSLGTRAVAWRVLLEGRASLKQAFFTINIGYLLNNLFPLRAGELGRAVFMGRAIGLSPFQVLSTIVIERAFDLVMAATLLLTTLPLALGMAWAHSVAWITLGLVSAGLVALYFVARNTGRVMQWVERVAGRWQLVKKHVLPRLESILKGFAVLTHPSQFVLSFFWIAISWGIWVIIYYVMLLTIAPNAPLWWAAFVNAVLAMGIALPSAPSALGIFEASIVGALAILGVSAGAIGYAFLMHIFQVALTGLLGFWGLLQQGRSLTNLFADLRARGDNPG